MGNKRETSDTEWAIIFEVRHEPCSLSCHLIKRVIFCSWCLLRRCRFAEAMLAFWLSLLGYWRPWTMPKQVGQVSWLCMTLCSADRTTQLCHSSAGGLVRRHDQGV